ncbi:MAG: iron-sulfur cluster assembly protein [Chloroflexi bacterium]|nr:iron-sulfur cluster assembly protein [Chloroflexota bacterium]
MVEPDDNTVAQETLNDTHPDASAILEKVNSALRQVVDPEIGLDVIALGLIRDIDIEVGKAHVVMILTTPFCPYGPQLLEQTRRAVQEASRLPTTIEMGLEMWDPSMMEEGIADDWGLF